MHLNSFWLSEFLPARASEQGNVISLVYPDPYKKGLGNKARSSVHIGMC